MIVVPAWRGTRLCMLAWGQVLSILRQRGGHDLAKGWFDVYVVVAISFQTHEALQFLGVCIQPFRFFRRRETVVINGTLQSRPRGDLIDDPFGMEHECRIDVVEQDRVKGPRVIPSSGEPVDCPLGKGTSPRSTNSHSPVCTRRSPSAFERSRSSCHSSGRHTLGIQRRPWPIPTTLTIHWARRSTVPTQHTAVPP